MFCISKVTPRIAPDDLIVVIVLKIRIYIALLFFVFSLCLRFCAVVFFAFLRLCFRVCVFVVFVCFLWLCFYVWFLCVFVFLFVFVFFCVYVFVRLCFCVCARIFLVFVVFLRVFFVFLYLCFCAFAFWCLCFCVFVFVVFLRVFVFLCLCFCVFAFWCLCFCVCRVFVCVCVFLGFCVCVFYVFDWLGFFFVFACLCFCLFACLCFCLFAFLCLCFVRFCVCVFLRLCICVCFFVFVFGLFVSFVFSAENGCSSRAAKDGCSLNVAEYFRNMLEWERACVYVSLSLTCHCIVCLQGPAFCHITKRNEYIATLSGFRDIRRLVFKYHVFSVASKHFRSSWRPAFFAENLGGGYDNPSGRQGEMQFCFDRRYILLAKIQKRPQRSFANASAKTCPVPPSGAGKPRISHEIFSQSERRWLFFACFAWFSGVSYKSSGTTGCRWRQSWWSKKIGHRYDRNCAELGERQCCTIQGDWGCF